MSADKAKPLWSISFKWWGGNCGSGISFPIVIVVLILAVMVTLFAVFGESPASLWAWIETFGLLSR